VRITECIACQAGDHDGHEEVVQAVPEGVMGGAKCLCRGECQGRPSGAFAEIAEIARFALDQMDDRRVGPSRGGGE
jgi:hypothetical protein